MRKLIVRNCEYISLQSPTAPHPGQLYVATANGNIPFKFRRIFFITNLSQKVTRGEHAHKKCYEVIFCISGSFDLHLNDGVKKQVITLNNPGKGVLVKEAVWIKLTNFKKASMVLVIAKDDYLEKDYIRDYDSFLNYIKINNDKR